MNINKLKQIMKQVKVTQQELADHLGMKQASLNYYFQKGDFRVADLEKIANYLQIDLCILFGDDVELSEPLINYQNIRGNNNHNHNIQGKAEIKTLKEKIKSLEEIIKSKDSEISTLKEMINMLKS